MSVLLLPVVAALAAVTPDSVFVSEVVYNPLGNEPDSEWIELVNVADVDVVLDELRLGDSESEPDNEGILQFPAGTTIPPRGHIVVANKSTAYQSSSGRKADFELKASDASVPELTADTAMGGTLALSLANSTDEIFLFDLDGFIVDGVTWGRAAPIDGVANFDGATEGQSLQRGFDANGPQPWFAAAPSPGTVALNLDTPEQNPPDEEPVPVGEGEGEEPLPVGEGEGEGEPEEEPAPAGEGEGEAPAPVVGPDAPAVDSGDDYALAPVPQTTAGNEQFQAAGGCASTSSSSSASATLTAALLLLLRRRR